MTEFRNPFRLLLDRPNDDHVKMIGIGLLTAVICGTFVSVTATVLRPIQQANIAAEQQARMERMLAALPGLGDLLNEQGVDALQIRAVETATGAFAPAVDPAGLTPARAVEDPAHSTELPPGTDIAGIRRVPDYMPVYLLESANELSLVVLPIFGQGYQSTIHAQLALEPDLRTVAALSITEQGETPGLGARIADDAWQELWPGTTLLNEQGEVVVSVVRGQATEDYQVDGISGATRTSLGVESMLRFWMGPHGYGPLLDRLEREGL